MCSVVECTDAMTLGCSVDLGNSYLAMCMSEWTILTPVWSGHESVDGFETEDDYYNPEVSNPLLYYLVWVTYDIPHPLDGCSSCIYILLA